ncbi:MAG: porin family protein [Ferruginibacter sp.]
MKKIILIAAIAVCSISSNAQVSFGAQVGASLGMGHASTDYVDPYYGAVSVTNDPKVGFLIGVLGEVEFGKIAFRPELNFIQKGSKSGGYYYGIGTGSNATKRTLNYVELPLNVVYNLELGKIGKTFFGLGPNLGFGISGKDKNVYDSYNDRYVTRKIKFDGKKTDPNATTDDGYNHLKRTDIGLNILAGFQLEMGAFVKVGYTLGLNDIDPDKNNSDPSYRSSYKNRGVSICVGYMLGGKKKK